ncbi:MAG: type II toxin-antitoxin system death-on-curing family toxin [Verrucomicrobia bacterium]|nr:type II toxin-antitoxin system death-on-curing family toxin [Verrucomicrobiota bacterium]
MKEPVWVRRDVVIAYHERLLAEHGGSPGIRDAGLLESALGRPENLFTYGKPTRFDLAASYAFGLVKNHPFIDGNKRIGFATAALFLELNDLRFGAPEVEVVLRTLALAAGAMTEAEYAAWLKANSTRA